MSSTPTTNIDDPDSTMRDVNHFTGGSNINNNNTGPITHIANNSEVGAQVAALILELRLKEIENRLAVAAMGATNNELTTSKKFADLEKKVEELIEKAVSDLRQTNSRTQAAEHEYGGVNHQR